MYFIADSSIDEAIDTCGGTIAAFPLVLQLMRAFTYR